MFLPSLPPVLPIPSHTHLICLLTNSRANAKVYYNEGRFNDAIETYKYITRSFKSGPLPLIALCEANMANSYSNLKKHKCALLHYYKAMRLYDSLGDEERFKRVSALAAYDNFCLGRFEEALRGYENVIGTKLLEAGAGAKGGGGSGAVTEEDVRRIIKVIEGKRNMKAEEVRGNHTAHMENY